MHCRASKVSTVQDDASEESDSEIIEQLEAEKEKELKKSDFISFCAV